MERKKSENKKIKNATPNEFDGISFKSITEKSVYRNLLKFGIKPDYEAMTFTVWKGFKPTVPFYDLVKVRGKREWKNSLNMKTLQDITYTPDFTFRYNKYLVIVEVKGIENDQFPLRKKMFRAYLETLDYPVIFAEIFTIKQLNEFMHELDSLPK